MIKSSAMIIVGAALLLGGGAAVFKWYSATAESSTAENAGRLEQGIALFEQERYDEALNRLQEIRQDEFIDWRVPYYIGSSHMMLQDYEQAAQSLERALALNSQQTGVLYALGVTHFKLGNLGLAKAYFAAVLEIDPSDQHAKGLMDIMAGLERQQPDRQDGGLSPDRAAGEPQS